MHSNMGRPAQRSMTRTKTMTVTPAGDDRFHFAARLTDSAQHANAAAQALTIHDFEMDGTLAGAQFTVVELDVRAASHPYAACPAVIPAVAGLVGRDLVAGWRKAVLTNFGGIDGCTHVNTLLLGLSELVAMIFFLQINGRADYNRDNLVNGVWTAAALKVAPGLSGVCHGLRRDGAAVTAADRRHAQPGP